MREPLFYLLLLLAVAYIIITPARMEFSNVKSTKNNNTENIKLPYSFNSEKSEEFTISFNLSIKNKRTAKFNIIPDDCIQEILINGKTFPLDGIKGLCDYSKGAYFDFSKYVQEESNFFEIRVLNHSGPGGLKIQTPYNGFKSLSFMHYVFTLLLLFSIALILRKFKFEFIAISIILLGIVVRLILYSYVEPNQYSNDTNGHLKYVQIISEKKYLPKNDECWSCFHPPLYYITSAIIKNIADRYDPGLTDRILQQESLLFSFAYVIFGVALILNLFGNSRIAYLAAFVSVLWPGFVISAPRIGNDSLFYFGALFCMLFVQRYWHLHKDSDMLLASIGAAIALSAKSTGFIILGVWIIVYVFSIVRLLKFGSLRTLLASAFIIALFAGFSNYRAIVDVFEGKKIELVGNTGGIGDGDRVNNTVGNYLYFDLQDYLMEPYTSPYEDKGGRQYFWNFVLKTSLFGEWRFWDTPAGYIFAIALSTLALLIFTLALWGIIHAKFKDLPPLFFVIFLFIGLIYLRYSYSYSCSNNFRYIFPALFPLVYFAVNGVQILENSRLKILAYVSMLLFAILSFLFIVGRAF